LRISLVCQHMSVSMRQLGGELLAIREYQRHIAAFWYILHKYLVILVLMIPLINLYSQFIEVRLFGYLEFPFLSTQYK
jgi:hypothetical protein